MTDTLTPERDIPAPKYEIVKVLEHYEEEGVEQTLTLVKLGNTHVARQVDAAEYFLIEHVAIGQSKITKQFGGTTYHYEETKVMGCNPDGTIDQPVLLYMVTRMVPIEHAMFAIGEV